MKRFLFPFILLISFASVAAALPSYDEVKKSHVKSDSLLLDRHGEALYELRTDKGRRMLDWTPLAKISPALREAVIQAEDRRFYDHRGADYQSLAAAAFKGLTSEGFRGASTISMQLTSILDREIQPRGSRRTIWQKGAQILAARGIEKAWTKHEILEAYLNLVTFRGELQGIAAASRGLFGKDPHGLDRPESLILASLIRAPNATWSELTGRVFRLSESMEWLIDRRELDDRVRQIYLGPHPLRPRVAMAPHVARQLLRTEPAGSGVASTLDSKMQRAAADRLIEHLLPLRSQNVMDGAVLVVENKTGDVLAYVSHSGLPSRGRFVDGVKARRQPGSTVKPFLYALAFDRRMLTPASVLDDTPLDLAVVSGLYQPRNYDNQFRGPVPVRVALASSLNVPAVKTLSLVGGESFLRKLRELGIQGLEGAADFYGPSLALGSADMSLYELVNAYRVLANEGEWSELRLSRKDRGSKGKRLFSREAVFLVSDILSDREARSMTFGLENPLGTRFWTAVKTGTSKDMRDNWCVGYSRKYTVGVWVGNFSGEPMFNVSGMSGAAPVWIDLMNYLHGDEASSPGRPSVNVINKRITFPEPIHASGGEWFIRGTEPDSEERRLGQYSQRILYPPSGTVIALDPDIPSEMQRLFFICQAGGEKLRWVLDGEELASGRRFIPWEPKLGKHLLSLVDRENRAHDSVRFVVKGPGKEMAEEEDNVVR